MPEAIKVLGQSKPAATTLTAVYTVPGATSAVVSTITAAEQAGTNAVIRVSVAIAGAADTPAQYLAYNLKLLKNDIFTMTIGLSLGAADVIRVYSDTGDVSFNVFGTEIT